MEYVLIKNMCVFAWNMFFVRWNIFDTSQIPPQDPNPPAAQQLARSCILPRKNKHLKQFLPFRCCYDLLYLPLNESKWTDRSLSWKKKKHVVQFLLCHHIHIHYLIAQWNKLCMYCIATDYMIIYNWLYVVHLSVTWKSCLYKQETWERGNQWAGWGLEKSSWNFMLSP